ncbi:MAG: DUF2892 domain-containing protein [Acidimicrobiales bacterium]
MMNEAGWDRVARVALAVVLVIVGFVIGGTAGWVLGIVALVPLVTGLSGWCPLYSIFHFRTANR